jgi:hypothetical protein
VTSGASERPLTSRPGASRHRPRQVADVAPAGGEGGDAALAGGGKSGTPPLPFELRVLEVLLDATVGACGGLGAWGGPLWVRLD